MTCTGTRSLSAYHCLRASRRCYGSHFTVHASMTAAAARRRSPCLPDARASDGLETLDLLLGLVLAAAALSCTYVLCTCAFVSYYMRRPAGDGTAGAMPAWHMGAGGWSGQAS